MRMETEKLTRAYLRRRREERRRERLWDRLAVTALAAAAAASMACLVCMEWAVIAAAFR